MKIAIASDSFKGSATSYEIAQWLEEGIHTVIPACEIEKIAIGDGGEGSLDAVLQSGFTASNFQVCGPVGNTVAARIGMKGETAFIEMAQASGLSQLPSHKVAPLTATSFGTGQLISHALDLGAKRIILSIGGSACTDAGAGALQALGAQILCADGSEVLHGGGSLIDVVKIDTSQLDPRIAGVEFILASDVTNPLLGPMGAARIYSPQKGADEHQVEHLEKSLTHFAQISGSDHIATPGAGAAGGLGFMALTYLHAIAQSGVETILDVIAFDQKVADVDLLITGEGRFDAQSLNGKAPMGVLAHARRNRIDAILVVGQGDESQAQAAGFSALYSLTSFESDIATCISNPAPLLRLIGQEIARMHI